MYCLDTLMTTSYSMISCQIFYQDPSLHFDFCRASQMYGALKCIYVKQPNHSNQAIFSDTITEFRCGTGPLIASVVYLWLVRPPFGQTYIISCTVAAGKYCLWMRCQKLWAKFLAASQMFELMAISQPVFLYVSCSCKLWCDKIKSTKFCMIKP